MNKDYLLSLGLDEEVADKINEKINGELNEQKLNFKIHQSIMESGAYNCKTVLPLLDMQSISLENDEVLGLKEQLKKIKASSPFLFKSEIRSGGISHGKSPSAPEPDNMFSALSDFYGK